MKKYTEKQGQYLAFIYYFRKIHGMAPSEMDMRKYFRVTPPTVHQMIIKLEEKQLIKRTPGTARSIELLLNVNELPELK
ncbi:MAG: hypothetical protein WC082_02180 [Victivallales bacterium]|jgi:repressor LexA|nr:hypothetical protein [Victivallaceae bacterium]